MLKNPTRLAVCGLYGLWLGGCVPMNAQVPVQDASTTPATATASGTDSVPVPSANAVEQLNQMNDLQAEVRELRNQLEEQQFELENMRQRQQDLFQGLDQRLRVSENMQRGNPEDAVVVSDVNVEVPPKQETDMAGTAQMPDTSASDSAVAEVEPAATEVAAVAGVDQQTLYDLGFEHLKQSRYTDAIEQFSALVQQYPDGGLADDASYWVGEANYVNRQYEDAIRAFRKVVAQYPSSDRVPEALLKVGYVQYDIGDYDTAKATFNDVLRRYADHPVAISAKSRIERIERGISN